MAFGRFLTIELNVGIPCKICKLHELRTCITRLCFNSESSLFDASTGGRYLPRSPIVLYMSLSFALCVPVASLIAAATVLPPMLRSCSFTKFRTNEGTRPITLCVHTSAEHKFSLGFHLQNRRLNSCKILNLNKMSYPKPTDVHRGLQCSQNQEQYGWSQGTLQGAHLQEIEPTNCTKTPPFINSRTFLGLHWRMR